MEFWDQLGRIRRASGSSWLIMGDFNAITSQRDKAGGRPFSVSPQDRFYGLRLGFGLIDLGFSGGPFTWSNRRHGDRLIRERLDRGVASPQWCVQFLRAVVRHFPRTVSDHSPFLLNTAGTLWQGP